MTYYDMPPYPFEIHTAPMKPDPYEAKRKRCKNPKAVTSVDELVVGRRIGMTAYPNPENPDDIYEIFKVEGDIVHYRKLLPNGFYGTETYQDLMDVLMFNDGVSII